MLYRLLKSIQTGEVQSLTEIARKLEISQDMVLRMAKELTNKGYLQEIGADCNIPLESCPDCPVSSSCQVPVRHWFLTEKGKASIAGD